VKFEKIAEDGLFTFINVPGGCLVLHEKETEGGGRESMLLVPGVRAAPRKQGDVVLDVELEAIVPSPTCELGDEEIGRRVEEFRESKEWNPTMIELGQFIRLLMLGPGRVAP
jgi:hypothetical protein